MKNTTISVTPELQKVLDACTNLPSLPAVALKIIAASKDPDISVDEILSIISMDAAISAKMLKLANSPLYSQTQSINNLHDALMLLGNNAALTVALCFSLPTSLDKNVIYANYWRRSILSASISRILGKRLGVTKLEDLFLASLLQDIGILVIQSMDVPPYLNEKDKIFDHADCIRCEKEVLGTEHPVIGAWLLQSWGLPDFIIKSVMHSHSLNTGEPSSSKAEANFHYCLSLSGDIADIWLHDPAELLNLIISVDRNILGMNESELNQLILEIDGLLPDISLMFEVSLVEEQDRRRVVDTARELLIERSISSAKANDDAHYQIQNMSKKVEKIEKENQLDSLTKVYNRQYFHERIKAEYDKTNLSAEPFSISFIDIDDFKLINDRYGHLVGDNILKLTADFFRKNTREIDIVSRFGGDEFLLMLGNSSNENSMMLLERLVKNFNSEIFFDVNDERLAVSLSAGVATYSGQSYFHNINGVLQAADEALYEAKKKGKNRVASFYVPGS